MSIIILLLHYWRKHFGHFSSSDTKNEFQFHPIPRLLIVTFDTTIYLLFNPTSTYTISDGQILHGKM